MLQIIWPDGHVDTGPTWEAVFDQIRRAQWYVECERVFRETLSDRALVWSKGRMEIDPDLPLPDLFRALEKAGMLTIVSEA